MGIEQSNGGAEANTWNDIPTLLAAAHELKSPLVLIRQLALEIEDLHSNHTAERIRLTAERSLNLVEGLTRVARLQDTLFECEPIYMPSLYADVAHEIYPLAKALNQTIELHLPQSQLTALGNRTLLRSVLLGLCDNALTHNDPDTPVRLAARKMSDRVVLSVRDNGPSSSTLTTIRRSIGTPRPVMDRPRSSGLGLLIAEQFASHMDAQLHIRRHRLSGMTFSLDLPASQQLSLLSL